MAYLLGAACVTNAITNIVLGLVLASHIRGRRRR